MSDRIISLKWCFPEWIGTADEIFEVEEENSQKILLMALTCLAICTSPNYDNHRFYHEHGVIRNVSFCYYRNGTSAN